MLRLLIPALLLLSCISACIPPSGQKSGIIRIKGSNTMLEMLQRLAEEYMEENPDISIYVEGGGTASGFSALIQNDANICSASRPITPEEASRIATKYNSVGIYTTIAKDALSIYVNSDNSIKDFSMKQLGLIFGGEIKNWQELGGMDTSVLLIVRQPNSGTNLYFKEHILDGQEYGLNSHTVATNREVVNVVQQNIKAIGYGGITAGPDEMRASVDGIRASIDNVRYDLYPISRYLYLYTIKKPRGNIRKFMDWVVSREGQKIVEESGFISLWSFE